MTSTPTGAIAALRMNQLPNQGATVVPSELKAWVRFNRLDAVRGGPRMATYGLAEVCKTVIPAARTMSALRNNGNDGIDAAGTNRKAPVAMVSSPVTMERLYPIHSTIFPDGMENTK